MRHASDTLRLVLFCIVSLLMTMRGGGPAAGAEDEHVPVLKVGVPARGGPHSTLTTLVYWGGFPTKTACYEPLVAWDEKGTLAPALATSWEVSEDGRTVTLRLREGVRFHDGRPLDAKSVANHLVRWRGNPGNRWLGSTDRMRRIEVVGPLAVRVTLDEPWPFLEELAGAINPAYVVGPGAYDHEGTFERTVGTGPYRLVDQEPNRRYRYVRHADWWRGRPGLDTVELHAFEDGYAESRSKIDALLSGAVDLVADGSSPLLPREALAEVEASDDHRLWRWPGTATTLLLLNTKRGALADVAVRRRLAAAIDREALIRDGEGGYATPARTLFVPGRAGWPAPAPAATERSAAPTPVGGRVDLVFPLGPGTSPRLRAHARRLADQLAAAGFAVDVRVLDAEAWAGVGEEGAWDLAFRETYGAPYDPWITLQTLFLDRPSGETASSRPPVWRDGALREAIGRAFASRDPDVRRRAFADLQARLDEAVPLVPLFVSDTLAAGRKGIEGLDIGADTYDLGLGTVSLGADFAPARAAAGTGVASAPPPSTGTPEGAEPRRGEVPLPAENGWEAFLVHDNDGVGIWTVDSFQVFPRLACPEIIGLDDKGTAWVCHSYSGKWTPHRVLEDGSWLGGLAHGDVDPNVDGPEVYTGSEKGNVYELVGWPNGILDGRLIGTIPGRAVNQMVVADLDPASPGDELLIFTWPGGLYRAHVNPRGRWEITALQEDASRVRQAIVMPAEEGRSREVGCVSRDGRVELLRLAPDGPAWETIYEAPMGMGRLSLRPPSAGGPPVLYATHDDGRILRLERAPDRTWSATTIYLGPQGPRGIVAGRFHADPDVESVALFGYSGRVELLSRRGDGPWKAETLFRDVDKGHWIARAEVEGRNATDELVVSGYAGRIVLLARPPGYGHDALLTKER